MKEGAGKGSSVKSNAPTDQPNLPSFRASSSINTSSAFGNHILPHPNTFIQNAQPHPLSYPSEYPLIILPLRAGTNLTTPSQSSSSPPSRHHSLVSSHTSGVGQGTTFLDCNVELDSDAVFVSFSEVQTPLRSAIPAAHLGAVRYSNARARAGATSA